VKKTVLLYLLSFLSLNVLLNKALSAQNNHVTETDFNELKEHFDQLNGPDYTLLNGRQYERLKSGNSHPFFKTEQYRPGNAFLNGEAYDSVTINYDIYDQQLILQYPGNSGQDLQIVLNRKMIDHFQIDGLTFKRMSFPETGSAFFQMLYWGDISCFLRWEKTLIRSTVSGTTNYKYSKQSRWVYLQRKGHLFHIKNSSSFANVFDEAYRKEIKDFLRREKINFRNASDEQLGKLMDFCINLIHGG
jgi:hypothetical protein